MSRDLLVRAVVAVPVAMLVPLCWRTTRSLWTRLSITGVLIAGAVAPHLSTWRGWAVLGAGLLGSLVAEREIRRWRAFAAVLAASGLAVTVGGAQMALAAVEEAGDSRGVVLVIAGFLMAVFLGGLVVGGLLTKFAGKGPGRSGLENAGTYIGWLERTILYVLFVAGAPDAAAIVIAGKSVARFPMFAEEKFAEYYLVGSLLSLGIAAALGLFVRAALGLHPLVATKL